MFDLLEDSPLSGREFVKQIMILGVIPFGGLFVPDLGFSGRGKEMTSVFLLNFRVLKLIQFLFTAFPVA